MSSKFNFRFTRLISLREKEVETAQRNLAEATRLVQQHEMELCSIHEEKALLQESWRTAATQKITADVAIRYNNCRDNLDHSLQKMSSVLAGLREKETSCRVLLDLALQRKKTMEKLHDKEWFRFTATEKRLEQSALDESAILRRA